LLNIEVSELLKKIKLSHSIEEKVLNTIDVDILFDEDCFENQKQVIIDIHGYNHYMRNTDHLRGKNILKRTILEKYRYTYIEIKITDWELLDKEQKTKYLEDLLFEKHKLARKKLF
jgi:hypothetical protein